MERWMDDPEMLGKEIFFLVFIWFEWVKMRLTSKYFTCKHIYSIPVRVRTGIVE